MVKYLVILFVLIISSCTMSQMHRALSDTDYYQLEAKVKGDSLKIIKQIEALIASKGLNITYKDYDNAYFVATLKTAQNDDVVWTVQVIDERILASSFVRLWGVENYFNDNTPSGNSLYWDIRNGIEKLFGCKFVVTKPNNKLPYL